MPITSPAGHSWLTERTMVKHVIVDGSNIATEGRSKPSLKQLNEAVLAFIGEFPKTVVTVIVDATFGHRIDPKEVAAFNKAVDHNELVTPPAGTVGRGDAFVLGIAEKANAAVLSNDSYQEFHGQHKWLFDEGRLIGGKPVPNVGWVFVERLPVRGEKSRLSQRASRTAGTATRATSSRKASAAAMKPMPIPTSPPPGATLPMKKSEQSRSVNDILPFLAFVESHTVGSVVAAVVESYSSHGAYVQIGDLRGYVPLRFLGDPPPRSARDAMRIGDTVTLEVVEILAARRSVNLKPAGPDVKPKKTARKTSGTKAASGTKVIKKAASKGSGTTKAPSSSPKTSGGATKKATASRSSTVTAKKKSAASPASPPRAKKRAATSKATAPKAKSSRPSTTGSGRAASAPSSSAKKVKKKASSAPRPTKAARPPGARLRSKS